MIHDRRSQVYVLTKTEELDTVRLAGKVTDVLDARFATSTIVTAIDIVPRLREIEQVADQRLST